MDPRDYFGAFGVEQDEILSDGLAFWETLPERVATGRRYGGHVLTGPIYVDSAEPGDTIAVDILDIDTRVPYGFNNTTPTSGVMATSVIRTVAKETARSVAPRSNTRSPVRSGLR